LENYMKSNVPWNLLAGVGSFLAASSVLAAVLIAPMAPPAPRFEAVPAARPGFAWDPGRWNWVGGRYAWVGGHWLPARPGFRWDAGHWIHAGAQWRWIDGRWIR
jgi:hypothetical protein